MLFHLIFFDNLCSMYPCKSMATLATQIDCNGTDLIHRTKKSLTVSIFSCCYALLLCFLSEFVFGSSCYKITKPFPISLNFLAFDLQYLLQGRLGASGQGNQSCLELCKVKFYSSFGRPWASRKNLIFCPVLAG